jgi:hypothetical protein
VRETGKRGGRREERELVASTALNEWAARKAARALSDTAKAVSEAADPVARLPFQAWN